jgi:diadenosine tetraphosphate (Ap4A) HIT family hydrolase
MTLPYQEPLVPRAPGPRTIPEPPRAGDPGGPPCRLCPVTDGEHTIWSDDRWILNHGVDTSLPGAVWLGTRTHLDSFLDLPPDLAAEFGGLAGRIERAILGLGDVGRVHVYRGGDGGAHFHVWFMPRPLGMLEATKMMLPLWEDVLPKASDEAIAAAKARLRAALAPAPA